MGLDSVGFRVGGALLDFDGFSYASIVGLLVRKPAVEQVPYTTGTVVYHVLWIPGVTPP